jgi:hypothetical protein
VSKMYVQMFRLDIIKSILEEKVVRTNQKIIFFLLFWGIWAPPNGPKKVLKSPQVGGMYVPMLRLEKKPLTK